MNRLQSLFDKKQNDILSVYFTAGYPTLDSIDQIITSLAQKGVDMIEIGVPFSDPMADGPVIQQSSSIALQNGITLEKLLDSIQYTRTMIKDVPLILMGYLNPVIQYGIERLFRKCKEASIDGLIIPDLPFDEYISQYEPLCRKYDIPVIMLITPETSKDRVKLIDKNCYGFIYMVSSASTTGTRDSFTEEQLDYFKRIDTMHLQHRHLIGFGISNAPTFNDACRYSSGAIIGSLFIKCLERNKHNINQAVNELLTTIGR